MTKLSNIQKITALTVLIGTLICLALGITVRRSYTDTFRQMANSPDTVFMLGTDPTLPDGNYDLLLNADIIVRAEASEPGIVSMNSIRSELTVKETYKGNLNPGDVFYFRQDSRFAYDSITGDAVFFSGMITNVIQPNKEYIIFGNRQYVNEKYEKYNNIPSYTTVNYPLTDLNALSAVSYFDVDSKQYAIINQEDMGDYKIAYVDVKSNEIFCYSQQNADAYYKLKSKIFDELNING